MLKCSDIMYCFEWEDTLFENSSKGFMPLPGFLKRLGYKNIFNPNTYDIRWSVVTGNNLLDVPGMYVACFRNGLTPCEIINTQTFFRDHKVSGWQKKLQLFWDILDGKRRVKYTKRDVKKVIYVSNNAIECSYLNERRNGYPIIAANVVDFKREFFNQILV